MKCGKEIPDTQVFCDSCLEEMERHPVKPGTTVQLPVHTESSVRRQNTSRRESTPEEDIHFLRKTVSWLFLLITALMLGLCLTVTSLLQLRKSVVSGKDEIGKNYNTAPQTTQVTDGK